LTPGAVYVLRRAEVGQSSTTLYLHGAPYDVGFGSEMFEPAMDADERIEEMRHLAAWLSDSEHDAHSRLADLVIEHLDELYPVTDAEPDHDDEPTRHPRVVWANAITSNPTELLARCFTTAEEAFEAAVSEWPYNNTRLSVRWCTADHQEATTTAVETGEVQVSDDAG